MANRSPASAARIPNTTLAPRYTAATATSPARANTTNSHVTVENVVNAPQNPYPANGRTHPGAPRRVALHANTHPNRNAPTTLIPSVTHGNPGDPPAPPG